MADPRAVNRDLLGVERQSAANLELRVGTSQRHDGDAHRVAIEHDAEGRPDAEVVVEERQIQPVDGGVDGQRLAAGKLAAHALLDYHHTKPQRVP